MSTVTPAELLPIDAVANVPEEDMLDDVIAVPGDISKGFGAIVLDKFVPGIVLRGIMDCATKTACSADSWGVVWALFSAASCAVDKLAR
jgi:hypothetical protein